MLEDVVVEKDVHEARTKAKASITAVLNGDEIPSASGADSVFPEIEYDEDGAPRPARMVYDEQHRDDVQPRRARAVQPLPPETVPTDDYDNPFPGLDPPLG